MAFVCGEEGGWSCITSHWKAVTRWFVYSEPSERPVVWKLFSKRERRGFDQLSVRQTELNLLSCRENTSQTCDIAAFTLNSPLL